MGFRIEGIGGLVGIHRTIDRVALLDGMRDNTLDNLLFPDDPIKNAAVIFRQANAVFPAAQGSHTFGIMFLLSWGTKNLVQLQLGLVLKYQEPTIIALLGVLKIGVEKTVLGKKVEISNFRSTSRRIMKRANTSPSTPVCTSPNSSASSCWVSFVFAGKVSPIPIFCFPQVVSTPIFNRPRSTCRKIFSG